MTKTQKAIFVGVVCNVLEAYDFLLYGVYAHLIASTFFPHHKHSLLITLSVFATGFLARPVGALILGTVGDQKGRRKALFMSACFMSIPSITMAFLPSYHSIGIMAPVILMICRLIQGISVGGEFCGASVFVIEHASKSHVGVIGSLVPTASVIGSLLAVFVAYIMTLPVFPDWFWRVSFIVGGLMGVLGVYIRWGVMESPEFKELFDKKPELYIPLNVIVKNYWRQVLFTIGIGGLCGVLGYTLFTYINIFFKNAMGLPFNVSLTLSAIGLVGLLVMTPLSGQISDKFGHAKVMFIGSLCIAFFAYPFYLILHSVNYWLVIPALLGFSFLASLFTGPSNALMCRLFPVEIRYRGVALGFNIGMSIFGGTTPMINTFLIDRTHDYLAPAFYLCIIGIIGCISVLAAMQISKEQLFYTYRPASNP